MPLSILFSSGTTDSMLPVLEFVEFIDAIRESEFCPYAKHARV
jgi:hypothetical protein